MAQLSSRTLFREINRRFPLRSPTLPLGPLKTVDVFWMAGMSCDGCTVAVAGATNPGIEGLLLGTVPTMPQGLLLHTVLSVEAGDEFIQPMKDARLPGEGRNDM